MNLPKWLPNGDAVVRWDWYALHGFPSAELYAQCTDVTVAGSDDSVSVEALALKSYSVINPPIYPTRSGNGGLVYRNPRGNNRGKFFMTGPDCIGGITGNCCDVANYAYGAGYGSCQNTGTSAGEPPSGADVSGGGAPTPAPTPSSNPCVLYNVVSGDSLSSIAADFSAKQCSVTAAAIAEFNMVANTDAIDVGETYNIPCPGNCCTDNSCVAGQQGGINNKADDPIEQATQDAKDRVGSLSVAVGLLSTVAVGLLAVIVKSRRGTSAGSTGSWLSSNAAGPPAAASTAGSAPPPLPPKPNAKPTRFSKNPEVGGDSAINLKVEASMV